MAAELGVGLLAGFGDDDFRLFVGEGEDLLAVPDDALRVGDFGGDGGADLVDDVEQAVAVDGAAAAEAAAAGGEQRFFELIDEWQDVDGGLLGGSCGGSCGWGAGCRRG